MRLLLAFLFWVGATTSLQADTSQSTPLVVPYTSIPPFMFQDAQGNKSGFIVSLSEMIGTEIGVPIEYLNVANSREFVAAQASGQAQMIAGILQLPPLTATNVFSHEVERDELRPAVLNNDRLRFEKQGFEGQRIAIVPPSAGSKEEILKSNIPVNFETPQAALMALLTQEVEAVLLPSPTIYGLAKQANLDGRIVFVGDPLQVYTRHIALHESRAELMPAINAAIAKFEADGRLKTLRLKYSISVPPPPPEVLTVAVAHFPPHLILGEDGEISGFIPDAMRDLAARANLDIAFVETSAADFVTGTNGTETDMIAGLVDTPDRRDSMDFSLPLLQVIVDVAFADKDAIAVKTVSDLSGLNVGVLNASIVERLATRAEGLNVSTFADNATLFEALLAGDVDAAMAVSGSLQEAAQKQRGKTPLAVFQVASVDTALAFRYGLEEIRNSLDIVIPGYLLSDRYVRLTQQYYGKPVYWTSTRVTLVGSALALIIFALLLIMLWQFIRQQRRDLAKEYRHNKELTWVNASLRNANQEQAEFTYAISHDLKSPANTLSMLFDELEDVVEFRDEAADVMGDIRDTNGRMKLLVEDVLEYSRLVETDIETQPVDLNAVMVAVQKDLSALIKKAGASLEVGDLPTVTGHPAQLRMLFQNLTANALKFRKEDRAPVVRITSETSGRMLVIEISDNGIGIAKKHQNRIFELFKRLHTHDKFEGSGLGLAICRRVMSNHNGEISVSSDLGHGTTFRLNFER